MVSQGWAQLVSDQGSEAFMAALRDRVQLQSRMPPLPAGWHAESAMVPADGFDYGGDFFVADVVDDVLQMVLVDACGHGPSAVPDALQFAGALGALVLTLPAEQVMGAANEYVYRRGPADSLTTAVQVTIALGTGAYRIRSAGHPPVLRWRASRAEWSVDSARGIALGATQSPAMDDAAGLLGPGEALLFYTDGVVETRSADIDDGVLRLRDLAREAVGRGFAGAPARILADLPPGEDDRAVLILRRDPADASLRIPGARGDGDAPGR